MGGPRKVLTDADFPKLKNDLIIRAARGEQTERSPVWIMRQAGRYLPEFLELRKNHGFFEVCKTPELACAITLQPIDRFAGLLDASIIFSDIVVVPMAMGMNCELLEKKGPTFDKPLTEPSDMEELFKNFPHPINVDTELGYVFDAITLTRTKLDGRVPIIGFCGAPWTLMAYMVEGGSSKQFTKVKQWLFKYPEASHKLLTAITDICIEYLLGQVKAGAQLLQVFDSNAGELSPTDFETFSLPYLKRIVDEVKKRAEPGPVPMIIFPRGAWYSLEALSETQYDVISLDWLHDPKQARERVKGKVGLQGNIDSSILYGSHEIISRETERMLKAFGTHKQYITNLGWGITPGVKPDDLKFFLQQVHEIGTKVASESSQK